MGKVCSQCGDVATFCKCFEKVVEEHEEGLINKAKELATLHHKGQTDKAGKPYIQHPLRLMEAVNSTNEKIVAVLHDIVEDTDVSFDDLQAEGFNKTVIDAIKCVTKIDGENYEDFIERISHNRLATTVKLADLADNMDLSRLPTVTEVDLERVEKYKRAKKYLLGSDRNSDK